MRAWVKYHKSVGFSHIYLYSSDDDPTALFRVVVRYTYVDGLFVTFLHWPLVGQQIEIYLHFLKTFKRGPKWYSFLDIDEFFVLKDVDDMNRFMRDYKSHVGCLYFNLLQYGNSDKVRPSASGRDRGLWIRDRSAGSDGTAGIRPYRGLGPFYTGIIQRGRLSRRDLERG